MTDKYIIPYINAEGEISANVIKLSKDYSFGGADKVILYNYAKDEKTKDEFLSLVKEISKAIDIPFYIGIYIKNFEDVKKAFYTGALAVIVKYETLSNKEVLKEAIDRFGSDKIIVELTIQQCIENEKAKDGCVSFLNNIGVGAILLKIIQLDKQTRDIIEASPIPIIIKDSLINNDIIDLLKINKVIGISTNFFENKDVRKAKEALKENGINVSLLESNIPFSEFKVESNGLVPVIVQDYKSGDVLMLAYMNEEAYNKTITDGKMTYYSRSRQSLWVKGETSDHYQYVKEMTIDCDKDTILAKVMQVGAACHTGNQTCFYTELVKKEYEDYNPSRVFNDVYNVIMDRRKNPKEGSYTNYLFDKGIDKILKKCGEEATEITIAAKNPGTEELRYEIADYLYHLMVLMAECGLDWKDITSELANRK
ncbi:MAG: bifunctional phosphoribosyl-AMP cyclohydrolase/phosphoribosyl-ATP diphosphatase HisIE [Clostridiales bacterium]|nr:bifunctional phosphoribosyl-AMP cyclohydrolase/phosphoribosyl-ATP diphosphatase HisIE [Clostridiales bacterium]